jgi:hypothetical protein
MPIRHTVENEVTVTTLVPITNVSDATPVESTDFDVRTFDPGTRFLLILDAFETVGTNTGGTWMVEESLTDGGSYTAATTSGSLAATGATEGTVRRTVSMLANPAKPFVMVTFTGASAATDVDISATLVALPRALL